MAAKPFGLLPEIPGLTSRVRIAEQGKAKDSEQKETRCPFIAKVDASADCKDGRDKWPFCENFREISAYSRIGAGGCKDGRVNRPNLCNFATINRKGVIAKSVLDRKSVFLSIDSLVMEPQTITGEKGEEKAQAQAVCRHEDINTITRISLENISEGLSKYRIVDPAGESRIFESMKEMGQLSPVIAAEADKGNVELLDGFKRLNAAKRLPGMDSLIAHILPVQGYAQKALILKLNWKSGHLRVMEEAVIIQSLHREDGLEQLEIAKLLGRHPSWVCRRLSLVEHLHEEVKSHIAVGLIPASFGRELAKLPRGNQEDALKCLVKHSFSRKETEILVRHLLKAPRWNWSKILYYPWELIHREDLDRPAKRPAPAKEEVKSVFERKLSAFETLCNEVTQLMEQTGRVPDSFLTRFQHIAERINSCAAPILKQREKENPCPF